MLKKLSQVQADLQALAAQKGQKAFEAAKGAYLGSVVVCDEDGVTPLAPDAITFDIQFEDEPSATKAHAPLDADAITKAIREEVSKALAPSRKSVTVTGGEIITKSGDTYRTPRGTTRYVKSVQQAHDGGMWLGAIMGNEYAKRYCASKGIAIEKGFQGYDVAKSQVEGVNTSGGFLVNPEFEDAMVVLRNDYGSFRRNARIVPMLSDTKSVKRQTGTRSAYFVGEASAGTASSSSFDLINGVAKKLMVLDFMSSEWSEDTAVAAGDLFANDVAYALALKEDQSGFIGDGTSTYGGIIGLQKAFDDLGTESNSAGVYSAAGAWSAMTMTDVTSWLGLLPPFARKSRNLKIFCHSHFYYQVLERLAFTAGGTTTIDIKDGVAVQSFMGYPVEFVQVLPSATATTQFDAFFGDLAMSSYFFDRRGITIATSGDAVIGGVSAFETDQIGYRATERFDAVNANVGNNDSTAANRLAGPIVAFYRAS